MLRDVTTTVMDVTASMVLVILAVTPDGKDLTAKMVMKHLEHIICTDEVCFKMS